MALEILDPLLSRKNFMRNIPLNIHLLSDEHMPSVITLNHDRLVLMACRWLKRVAGCGVIFSDDDKAIVNTYELPDAIGFRSNVSIMIECKNSRSDFDRDKLKKTRISPDLGMGDWRFYLCPQGLILPDDLPYGWGLLYAVNSRTVKSVTGVPGNCLWGTMQPFNANKTAEMQLMYSALRILRMGTSQVHQSQPSERRNA